MGSLLFLIFIYDMPEEVSHSYKLFADDTKLIGVIKNLNDRFTLKKGLDILTNWAKTWKMCFKESKCKVMYFGKRTPSLLNNFK